MRHRLLLWLICALFCLSLTGCGATQESPHQPQTQQEAQDGEELPGILSTFNAQNLEGEAVDQSILSDYPLTHGQCMGHLLRALPGGNARPGAAVPGI